MIFCTGRHLPVAQHDGVRKKYITIRFFLLENCIMRPYNVQCPSVYST